jgi:predicted nucleotidyltransferase
MKMGLIQAQFIEIYKYYITYMLHMEQKLADELVLLLQNGGSHARDLADRLGVNHMTVSRRLKQLVIENVLDFKVEGRNRVFHLKGSIEARNAVMRAELHKLDLILLRYPSLRGIASTIQTNPKVPLAILFGSHANATARPDSDIDLYIETKDRALKTEIESLSPRLSVKIGKYDRKSPLIREIERNHVIVKGGERYIERSGLLGQAA